MKAKCMIDKVLHPQYKKLALVLAVAWGSPLLANQVLAQDKPPVAVVEPVKNPPTAISTTNTPSSSKPNTPSTTYTS